MKRYPIGATEQGEPIFWHINSEHKITNGRIITMDRETGKVYDVSSYYQDGRPTCLFGEHLLNSFPTQTVALVTDEMTAAIMSSFPTPYVWLATGKEKATPTDLLPLVGKSVVVFPDKGDYSKWQETLQAVPNLQFYISDVMEKVQGDCHTIAQIALLVKALGLEVVGISPTSDIPKDETPKTKPTSKEPKQDAVMQSILLAQEERWHGRNPECHKCPLSHEGINGTYCGKLHRYVEYGKGDCGVEADIPPAPG